MVFGKATVLKLKVTVTLGMGTMDTYMFGETNPLFITGATIPMYMYLCVQHILLIYIDHNKVLYVIQNNYYRTRDKLG